MVKNQQQCCELFLSIFFKALADLWVEVNVTGFQTISPNSSIIVGSDPTTTVLTPSSITTTDAFLLQSMTVGSESTETSSDAVVHYHDGRVSTTKHDGRFRPNGNSSDAVVHYYDGRIPRNYCSPRRVR